MGISIVEEFFGAPLAHQLAKQGKQADLMVANNVLAHVPDINDFVSGFAILLKDDGVATFEFPHLLRLIAETLFDTIYHEHFSYLSLTAVQRIFQSNGMVLFRAEELPTQGGSLRVFAQRSDKGKRTIEPSVVNILTKEATAGLQKAEHYRDFQARTDRIKHDLSRFLLNAHFEGKTVAAYGAAAKGNTLLNYAGIRPDLLAFVVDRNPAKQGKYMPGSRIPIVDESHLKQVKPDYVLILPWNLRTEITEQLSYVKDWGGKFVTALPNLQII